MPQYLMPGYAGKTKACMEARVLSPVVGTMLAQIVENRSKFHKAHTNKGIDASELNRSLRTKCTQKRHRIRSYCG